MEILNEPPSFSSLLDYSEPTSRYRPGDLMDILWQQPTFPLTTEPHRSICPSVKAFSACSEVLSLSSSHGKLAHDGDPHHHLHIQENQSFFTATLDELLHVSLPPKLPTIITAIEDQYDQSSSSVQSSTDEFLYPPLDSAVGCNVNQNMCREGSILTGAFGLAGRSRLNQMVDYVLDENNIVQCAGELLDAWFLEESNEFSGAQKMPLQSTENNSLSRSFCDDSLNFDSSSHYDKEASQRELKAATPSKQSISCLGAGSVQDIGLSEERVDSGSDETSSVTRVYKRFGDGYDSQVCLGGTGCPGSMSDYSRQVVSSAQCTSGTSSGKSNGDYDMVSCMNFNSSGKDATKLYDGVAPLTSQPFDGNRVKIQEGRTRDSDSYFFHPSSPAWVRPEMDFSESCLVKLLIASAEAVATRDMDLASVILARLGELVTCSSSTIQRVAAYFSDGLQHCIADYQGRDFAPPKISRGDILAAFQVVHEICPFIKFGHFTANQAILEAVEGEKRVHIVDFEVLEGIQWSALMQALVSRKQGPPQLRITALCRPHAERGLAEVQETGKRLTDFATSLRLHFSFTVLKVSNEEEFSPSSVKIVKGEALVVNCMLHLPHMPHRTASSISSFLQGMRQLAPVVLTLVEEELGCNTYAASSLFDSLLHYSAICDSLDACLSNGTVQGRMLVERTFLAPRINSAMKLWSGLSARPVLGPDLTTYKWCSLVRSVGFKSLPLSSQNLLQARLLLGLYKDGFEVKEWSNGLILRWQGKPLFAASVWN